MAESEHVSLPTPEPPVNHELQRWSVAVDAGLNQPLTYQSEKALFPELTRGQRVWVPLVNRKTTGVILGPDSRPTEEMEFEIKNILSVDEEFPPLPAPYMRWLEWLSEYYVHPVGLVTDLAFPPLRRTARTLGSRKAPAVPKIALQPKHELNQEQRQAIDEMTSHSGFRVHLLFGVTGSGKTEVYLEMLEKVLADGKCGLFLVPEISLTPQLIRRFSERFGEQVATLHSQLTNRERTEQWWSIFEGRRKILIGARSALFCPIPNLGLIIIDEEHESSFKQEEKLKYHARDAAIVLAKDFDFPVILGSATPSLETWKNAIDGKYHLHRLKKRIGDQPLPTISVLDLRKTEKAQHLPGWMSRELHLNLLETLNQGQQAALFLNRRGYSSAVVCVQCGDSPLCPNCDIHLSLHGKRHLVCHYCDYSEPYKEDCRKCGGSSLPSGLGTEQIEEGLARLFPEARLARADRDEIQSRDQLEELIGRMEKGDIDILIGTQMIAKGLDFPRLRFAGLVLADIGFNLPEFRATERSFQLLTQMSGRAGRHGATADNPGRVLIQTYNPEHPSIEFAARGDYEGFAALELTHRKPLGYPPFQRLAVLRVQNLHRNRAWASALQIQRQLSEITQKTSLQQRCEILGPAEAPLARLKRAYRFHILIKAENSKSLLWLCQRVLDRQKSLSPGTNLSVDIDPLHLL
ncbi:MAG: primosomal protein N' [Bdellovibrio sp.]|nr:MAG: primosomal protein N' [Bdellovibrio sp.]